MSRVETISLFGLTVFFLFGCSTQPKSVAIESRRLSATEEFHLRGECAVLERQIEKDKPDSDSDDVVSWSSNYSPKDNRCFVLESSYNRRLGLKIASLYDGQTEEVLASTEYGKGQINGTIEVTPDIDCSPKSDCGYALAQKFISESMRRDTQ